MVVYQKYIESNPKVMLGKPKIKGTRLTVALILKKIADGYTFEEILQMYPILKIEHILASIAYAAEAMASEEMIKAA